MQADNFKADLPPQTPAVTATAKAISDAMQEFFSHPTSANKDAALTALQAHLQEMEGSNSRPS